MPAGTGGVAFYRMNQPYNWLKKQGHEIFIYDSEIHDSKRMENEQRLADILVFQCPWSEGILNMVEMIKDNKSEWGKKKIVIELDDNLFDVDPWNEKYNMFGIEEKSVHVTKDDPVTQKRLENDRKKQPWIRSKKNKDGSMTFDMWRDGYDNFDIETNLRKRNATIKLLNIADLITVTTPELGKQIRKYAPKTKIAVLPNLVDPNRWLPMKKNDTDEIRIGWQGGSAHFDDLRLIMKDLQKVNEKYPNTRFIFMGVQFNSIFQKLGDRLEWIPWHGDISTYPLIVRDLKLDIGLAPLVDTKFNRGKSPLKWVEYSLLGVPTVASDVVYSNYIKHGKTGLIAKKGEWFKYIEELILDKEKREEIARKANERILNKYTIENSGLWFNALQDIM